MGHLNLMKSVFFIWVITLSATSFADTNATKKHHTVSCVVSDSKNRGEISERTSFGYELDFRFNAELKIAQTRTLNLPDDYIVEIRVSPFLMNLSKEHYPSINTYFVSVYVKQGLESSFVHKYVEGMMVGAAGLTFVWDPINLVVICREDS